MVYLPARYAVNLTYEMSIIKGQIALNLLYSKKLDRCLPTTDFCRGRRPWNASTTTLLTDEAIDISIEPMY